MSDPPVIPDYQLHLPPLGQGAFGTVYHATYRGISERAIKVFKPDRVNLSTMARELEKLSSVAEHRGIITLHDFDLLGDTPYYAMTLHADRGDGGEWTGRTLEQLSGQVDSREAWRLLGEVAEAVAYLHRHHIIHCDLKPTNILLTDENPQRVKICDFGQSRGDRFDIDEVVGTPVYASPDELRSPRDSADGKGFRWDVYSFGVVAYKLITGELPRLKLLEASDITAADDSETLAESYLEATIEDPSSIDSERLAELIEAEPVIHWPPGTRISPEQRDLVERCLSLDPNERYADMREVRIAMQQIDQQARVRRSSRLNAVFAILLVIAIWASAFALVQARRAKEATEEAMKSRDQARELVVLVAEKLSRELSETGQTELINFISENTEPFLENLSDNERASRTLLRFSARTAAINGNRARDAGDYLDAMEHYRAAYEIHAQLAEARPDDPDLVVDIAEDLMQVGQMALRLEDYDTALESLAQALTYHQSLVPDGEAPTPRQLLLITETLDAIADAGLAKGDPGIAENAITEAIDQHRVVLTTLDPTDPRSQTPVEESLIRLHLDIGRLHVDDADLEEAEESFLEALELASISPADGEFDFSTRLSPALVADSLKSMADLHLMTDRSESALTLFNEELKIRRNEVARTPLQAEPRIALARAYANVADCFELDDPRTRDLALLSLERAVAEFRALPADLLTDPLIDAQLSSYRDRIASILELSE